jgi:nitrite reductase/ring-hydroxylating ferredoxin subunit
VSEGRYRVICVAPEVPGRGSFDLLEEARVNCDAHFEAYDMVTGEYVSPTCIEEFEAAARALAYIQRVRAANA